MNARETRRDHAARADADTFIRQCVADVAPDAARWIAAGLDTPDGDLIDRLERAADLAIPDTLTDRDHETVGELVERVYVLAIAIGRRSKRGSGTVLPFLPRVGRVAPTGGA